MKLDNYSSSFAIRYKGRSVKNHFREISEGTEVIVQIQRKDLDKIKNSNIQIPLEYSKSQFLRLPRMYGISTNEKVIITPQKALWDFSTPYVLSVISTVFVYFALFFGIGLLGWDLKGLYRLRKRKSVEKN